MSVKFSKPSFFKSNTAYYTTVGLVFDEHTRKKKTKIKVQITENILVAKRNKYLNIQNILVAAGAWLRIVNIVTRGPDISIRDRKMGKP